MPRAVRFSLTEEPPTPRTKPRHSDHRITPRGILRTPRTPRAKNRERTTDVSHYQTVVQQSGSGRAQTALLSVPSSATVIPLNSQQVVSHKRQEAVDFGRPQSFTNGSSDFGNVQRVPSTVRFTQQTRQALMPLSSNSWNQAGPLPTANISIYRPSTPSRFTPYTPPLQYTNHELENRVPTVQHVSFLPPDSPMHWTSVPYQPPPETALTASTIRLGRYLDDTNFRWNIIHPPCFAAYFNSTSGAPHNVDMAATDPPVSKLTIRFSLAHLSDWNLRQWDPLVVRPTSASYVVTIRDVIEAIHAYFQTPLRYHEYNYRNTEDYRLLMDSYMRRVTSLRYQGLGLRNEHLRRVDVLLGATQFMGMKLASVRHGRVKFVLSLGYDSSS